MLIPWSALLLPTLVAAVLIFVASSIIHMVLKLHKPDYRTFSNEDEVRAALRKGTSGPGQYFFPFCGDSKEMASPAMVKKYEEGPIGVCYIGRSGQVKLGPFLMKWVLYTILVSLICGYIAASVLGPGSPYLKVFQIVGASAWLAYSWQAPSDMIWKQKPFSVVMRGMLDGLIYACLTAGSFAWLWPKIGVS